MKKTKVVHCKEESYDVYIGRPSKWGNPYKIGKDGTREEVIEKYRQYIFMNPQLRRELSELKCRTLGCWCHPESCHGGQRNPTQRCHPFAPEEVASVSAGSQLGSTRSYRSKEIRG